MTLRSRKDTANTPDEEANSSSQNLWDAASDNNQESGQRAAAKKVLRAEDVSTILVLGSRSGGKSTLIGRLLEKNETPKPTLALDFTFARRTTPDLIKEICHIWELGGDAITFSQLIETPIKTNHALDKFSIFLVLDLSVPEKIWATLDTTISSAKKALTRALADNLRSKESQDMTRKLEENIKERLGDDCQDRNQIEPFPLPLVIICTKYDVFQNFEPEKRKLICRILRLASHRLGASLNFYSMHEVAHNRRVRELFTHYAFGTPFPKGIVQDYNKALLIPPGGDSYDQIWPGTPPNQFSMDFFKHLFETQVGKYNEKLSIPDDPADDANFHESDVDSRRSLILEDIALTEKVRQEYSKADNLIL
ncbi:Cytoplasmic dynein 2 light intermediate chain 1 [Orchesella cincta]|uniref:Cytoplasmic dynein 2 light intermediate chain 1 n=1 Tax=Orchesella cincta TaxID=48709 RepID=A0A1D2MRA1_ORCCI|nr:Cytoplasmic dynein 2 light intermediate chain 1 [Orchesella cincta]